MVPSVVPVGLHRQDGWLVQTVLYLNAVVGLHLPVFVVNYWYFLVTRFWVDEDRSISSQQVSMSCEFSVLLNGVQSVHATTIYVSNSHMCLESVTCWWRYLVRCGRLEVSFLYGQCYLFLRIYVYCSRLCSCVLYSRISYVHLLGVDLGDQHVAILSSAKWFSFALSMISWVWQDVGMVMHGYAYECLEEWGKR